MGSWRGGNTIVSTTSSDCFYVANGVNLTVRNVKLQTATGGACLHASRGATITYNGVNFGACANVHTLADTNGTIYGNGNYTISGGAISHWYTYNNGSIIADALTVTLTGTPAFSAAFAVGALCGTLECKFVTFSGSATGVRYSIVSNGAVDTNGGGASYLPGSVAGSTSTGGQYV